MRTQKEHIGSTLYGFYRKGTYFPLLYLFYRSVHRLPNVSGTVPLTF